MRRNSGFTLIELIIVIVLLGILAATALPRFVDFSSDARKANYDALKGSVITAMNLTHAACRIDTSCANSGASTVSINSVSTATVNGYPSTASICSLVEIDSGTTCLSGLFKVDDKANCQIQFVNSAGANVAPTLTETRTCT